MDKIIAKGERREIAIVNPYDRDSTFKTKRFVLWFGQIGTSYLMVWADSLDDAIEVAGEWLAEHAPGHIMPWGSDAHAELLKEACKDRGVEFDPSKFCGVIEEPYDSIITEAEADLTLTESGFITSHEWGLEMEDPDRDDVLSFLNE